jgi:ubiquinone/menaquinone biosynthesis C-methylase UbiE
MLLSYENVIDPWLKDVRRITPEFAGMQPGERVLDVCCGTGEQVFEYGRRGIMANGIDCSRDMLMVAMKNRQKHDSMGIHFRLADAANLPFPDDYYDYASISFGLHDKENSLRDKVVAEMKRVVKPGGSLIFTDFQAPLPRNIWAMLVRTVEFIAGGSHYRGFRDYIKNDGLDGLKQRHSLQEDSRTYLKDGVIVMMKLANGAVA